MNVSLSSGQLEPRIAQWWLPSELSLSLSTWLHQSRVSGQPPGFLALRVVPGLSPCQHCKLVLSLRESSRLRPSVTCNMVSDVITLAAAIWLVASLPSDLSQLWTHLCLNPPMSGPAPVSLCPPMIPCYSSWQLSSIPGVWSLVSSNNWLQLSGTSQYSGAQYSTVHYTTQSSKCY